MLPSILRLQRRLHWATCLRAQGRRQPREGRNGAWGGKGRQSSSETPGESNSCVGGGWHSGWAEMEPSQDGAQHCGGGNHRWESITLSPRHHGWGEDGTASTVLYVPMDAVRMGTRWGQPLQY